MYEINHHFYDIEQIVYAISRLETNYGRAGVGKYNNPCSIKCGNKYCIYKTLEDGYLDTLHLWEKKYAKLDITTALALWKTGNPHDRTENTIRYANQVIKTLESNAGY